MSTCFQKQVGKRKKKEDDEDDSSITAPTSNSDELMIIDDSNGHEGNGRTERLNKRRKKEERDESLEKAIFILRNEFDIPVDGSMSRNEVIDLASVLIQSKQEDKSSSTATSTTRQGRSGPSKRGRIDSDHNERSSSDEPEKSRSTKSTYKQRRHRQEEMSDEERSSHSSSVTRRKSTSTEKQYQQSSSDAYEPEEPIPRNDRKVSVEKTERKRQLEEEESQSSQESGYVVTRPKKSRNFQLNKKQLETMQAKTSSLLKKSAATVRLSQENPSSPDSQRTSEVQRMADDDEETQAPGSQELFAGETVLQDEALPGTPASDESDSGSSKPRTLRSSLEEKIPAEKFMELVWPPHVPMKRTHFTKAALQRETKRNESANTSYFAPSTKNPVSYTKVIIQLFNIYFGKLRQEQMKMGPCTQLGEPVKPGRCTSRTVDVKARGLDTYHWSSESNDDVTIRSDKSSDEDSKGLDGQMALRSKAKGRMTKTTRSKKVVRSTSYESPKGSESDFVSEHQRIQPRRSLATPREPIHRYRIKDEDDDDSLPDLGISSSDKPPQAGQSCYSGDTQPMSPVFATLVEQTLPMEDDLYMADTETLEPDIGELQNEESDNPSEIQPRKKIQRRQSPVGKEEESDDSVLPMNSKERKKTPSPATVTSSYGTRRKGRESPLQPLSQESSNSRGSGSILNSQGEIKSFQKTRSGTFNFDIEDVDSKGLDVDALLNKRDLHERCISKSMANASSSSEDENNLSKTSQHSRKKVKDESSDSDTVEDEDKLDLVHDSPVISTINGKNKFLKRKGVKADAKPETTSEDDFFSKDNSDFEKSKKGLRVYSLSSDSTDDQKPSTSRKERVIPIVLTNKFEKRTTTARYASVKPLNATQSRRPVNESDDSADITEIHQTERQEEEKIACPMCSKMFGITVIQQHASDCLGQQEVTSTTGDDDAAAVGTSTSEHGLAGDVHDQERGEHSVRTKAVKEDGGHKEPIQRRVKPFFQRHMERCCVCDKHVAQDEIEQHTDRCIAANLAKMEETQQHETGNVDLEADAQERRSTRSRARDQGQSGIQPRRVVEVDDIESVSSETSDTRDPDWTEASATSATEQESPIKFKKISQLDEPVMDFKNQFKSKSVAKRGAKRGGNSRGRGKK